MSGPLTIVVTGSNRGIGYGIATALAQTKHTRPLNIYATSRSGADLEIKPAAPNKIHYSSLDIGDASSIDAFFADIKKQGPGIDVLINNAGINNNQKETPELAAQTIATNYAGTKNMCLSFLKTLDDDRNPPARIVNVSSTACALSNYSDILQRSFRNVKSIQDVDNLSALYVDAVEAGPQAQKDGGWGPGARSYQVSKALMNALTVVLAKENPKVMINCCCPGWVESDMGHQIGSPPKSLEEGARIPVRLAIGDLGSGGEADGGLGKDSEEVSGKYFGNDGVSDREWGRARSW